MIRHTQRYIPNRTVSFVLMPLLVLFVVHPVVGQDTKQDRPEKKELVRPVSPEKPMFYLKPGPHSGPFWEALPEDIRDLFVMAAGDDIKQVPERPIMISLTHLMSGVPPYSTLERLFRDSDNTVGFLYPEAHYEPDIGVRNLEFAARHGRYTGNLSLGLGSIVHGSHKKFYSALDEYGKYFLPMFKSQNPSQPLDGQINLIGLWLTGRVENWGTETERWFPLWPGILAGWRVGGPTPEKYQDGRIRPQQRPIDWMPTFLLGLAYGATSYRVEGSIGGEPKKIHHRIWIPKKEKFGSLWRRAIGPFFKDIVRHDMIPTREEVKEHVKAAIQISPEQTEGDRYPTDLTTGIHGVPTPWYQWIPDNPRFGIVPVLPAHATDEERAMFDRIIYPENYDTAFEAKKELNKIYDPVDSAAFAVRSGDTGVIMNSKEMYRDVPLILETMQKYFGKMAVKIRPEEYPVNAKPQYYFMKLTRGPAKAIEGNVAFHEYVILKQSEDQLFIHTNDYREHNTTVHIHTDRENLRVKPESAMVDLKQTNRGLKVVVSHDHPGAVARIFVR